MTQNPFLEEFMEQSHFRMNESLRMIRKCLDLIDDNQLWRAPNESTNSVGNLMLHLCGNIRQYAISGLSGAKDTRQRDLEFTATNMGGKEELFDQLKATVSEALTVMHTIKEDEWMQTRKVQGFVFSGIGLVLHAVEHLSYHTGQVALLTKILVNRDLGFYDGVDLNIKNS